MTKKNSKLPCFTSWNQRKFVIFCLKNIIKIVADQLIAAALHTSVNEHELPDLPEAVGAHGVGDRLAPSMAADGTTPIGRATTAGPSSGDP